MGRPKGSKNVLKHPNNWQEWQQLYANNIACLGVHRVHIQWQCICCNKRIEFNTDDDIKFDNVMCKDCISTKALPTKSSAKILRLLSYTLLNKRFKSITDMLNT